MRHAHLDSDKLMSHLQSQESLSDQYAGVSRTLSFSPSFSLGLWRRSVRRNRFNGNHILDESVSELESAKADAGVKPA